MHCFGDILFNALSTCSSHSSSVSLSNASSSACCSGDKPLYRFSKYSARSSGVFSRVVKPATSVGMCLELTFPALSAEKLDTISAKTGHSRNELIGIFLEYAAECCVLENKWQSMYNSTCVCKKNLNNVYFRENDDVKNTGFNLFLFKDTIVKIEFE